MIQLGWNVIIKALRGAESSKNRTCKREQPILSLPPGYFTYLQSKQHNTAPPLRLLAVIMARSRHSLLGTAHLLFLFFRQGGVGGKWVDGWVGVGLDGWGMRKWWEAVATNCCRPVITVSSTWATVTWPNSLTQWPSLNKASVYWRSWSATLGSARWIE